MACIKGFGEGAAGTGVSSAVGRKPTISTGGEDARIPEGHAAPRTPRAENRPDGKMMMHRGFQAPGMSHLVNRLPLRGGRARWAAVLLVAGLLAAVLALRDQDAPDRFPPISISTIDGRSFDSTAFEGRPLLVTFWSTTCLVCLHEMPDLEALYRRLSPHGFEIIAVSMPWDPPGEVVRLARARAPLPGSPRRGRRHRPGLRRRIGHPDPLPHRPGRRHRIPPHRRSRLSRARPPAPVDASALGWIHRRE